MTAPDTPTPQPPQFVPYTGRTVLVVEDERTIRMIARSALAMTGLAVSEAGDLTEAAAAVRAASRPFDLVVLDLNLVDGAGTALIPLIRQHSPRTRILVVSGSGDHHPTDFGADGYLSKPFTRVPLLAAVQRVLDVADRPAAAKPV